MLREIYAFASVSALLGHADQPRAGCHVMPAAFLFIEQTPQKPQTQCQQGDHGDPVSHHSLPHTNRATIFTEQFHAPCAHAQGLTTVSPEPDVEAHTDGQHIDEEQVFVLPGIIYIHHAKPHCQRQVGQCECGEYYCSHQHTVVQDGAQASKQSWNLCIAQITFLTDVWGSCRGGHGETGIGG